MFGALTLSAADNDDIESMVETLLNKMTLEEIIPLLPEAKVTENNRMTDDFCQKFILCVG